MLMMIEAIGEMIHDYLIMSGQDRKDIMIVMGNDTLEKIKAYNKKVGMVEQKGEADQIFGVEIYPSNRIRDDIFGVCLKSCKDHIDDHIEDLLRELPAWIQCDLCGHPLSTELAVGDDITCLWCGDVNDLDDLLEDDE
jgi:hypothetical protein